MSRSSDLHFDHFFAGRQHVAKRNTFVIPCQVDTSPKSINLAGSTVFDLTVGEDPAVEWVAYAGAGTSLRTLLFMDAGASST